MLQHWKRLAEQMGNEQRTSVYVTIMEDIAEHNASVARDLKAEYLKAASNSISEAAKQFFNDWRLLAITYQDVGRLRCYLQREAEKRSQWARGFLGNAPLIASSIVTWVSSIHLYVYYYNSRARLQRGKGGTLYAFTFVHNCLPIYTGGGGLKMKYPTRQYAISPQPVVRFYNKLKLLNPDTSLNPTVYSVFTAHYTTTLPGKTITIKIAIFIFHRGFFCNTRMIFFWNTRIIIMTSLARRDVMIIKLLIFYKFVTY